MKAVRILLPTLVLSATALTVFSGCNATGAGSESSGGQSVSGMNDAGGAGNGNANTGGAGGNSTSNSNVAVGESCQTGDSNHLCLAMQFVTYSDSSGQAVASRAQAATIVHTMNNLFAQCNIGFQIETYQVVNPADKGLAYSGTTSAGQTDAIRSAYGTEAKELLSVTTGPWGTTKNAWTNMPGNGPYGAVMEAGIVDYGNGIIYAHEFGHYLGLDHVSDTGNLMDAIIYTSSDSLSTSQCNTARSVAQSYWSAMLR